MESKFSKSGKKILFACVLVYSVAYINRLNLSAALSYIGSYFSVSVSQTGLLQSLFAVTYAIGQFANGMIVDRVDPAKYILVGIIGFSTCNLIMGLCSNFALLMLFCVLNGVFQSMLWTPIVRIVAQTFISQEERKKANFYLALTLVIGHFSAWAISGFMAEFIAWRFSFVVPAVIGFITIIIYECIIRSAGYRSEQNKLSENTKHNSGLIYIIKTFGKSGMMLVLGACILYGFTRDGIITWAPTVLNESGKMIGSTLLTLIIPLINTVGVILGFLINRRGINGVRQFIAFMLFCCALSSGALCTTRQLFMISLFMGIACAAMYGLNPFLTTMVPLEYDKEKLVGFAAGIIDSFIYLGSSLAGFIGGNIYTASGVNGLGMTWMLLSLLACIFMFFSVLMKKKYDSTYSL